MKNLIAILLLSLASAQLNTGTAQVGDGCLWDNDCVNWNQGQCCVEGQNLCSSDNGWTDYQGREFAMCKGTESWKDKAPDDLGPIDYDGPEANGSAEEEAAQIGILSIILILILTTAAIGGGYYAYTQFASS